MGRIDNAARNIFFGYLGNILRIVLSFVSRTVFIYTLGATYLGVNGLYTNILSILSLAELGIGSAMNYSLYKPVAEKDYEKIKSLMYLYKKAYRVIAIIISIVGLALVPFLKYVIKEPGNITIKELTIYYLIFLFNTVSTYFVAYKYSLANAEQKNYIQSNIQSITYIVTSIAQIIVLLVFKNFLLYLLTASIIGLLEKIFASIYLNRLYPFLREKEVKKLSKEEKVPIIKNIKALMIHKIGDISVHSTDDIIISTFINVTTVGYISNYNSLMIAVNSFLNILFNSVISGFGNLIVTESKEKQYQVFKAYRFLAFWLYGFASIALFELSTPFISLWLGYDMVIEQVVIGLILANYYFMGHRIVINNFKSAAGIWDEDKYISIIQAVVNLVVSIVLVQKLGLTGVYIGTICSGLVATFTRPYIVYNKVFDKSVWDYYKDSIIYIIAIVGVLFVLEIIKGKVLVEATVSRFIIMVLFVAIIPNVLFYILFKNREEYKYLETIIKTKFIRRG